MDDSDPFDDLVLDESFVRAADRREPSAAERVVEARQAEALLRIRPSVPVAPRRRRRGRLLVALLLLGVAVVVVTRPDREGSFGRLRGDDQFVIEGQVTRYPSPPDDVADEPLGLAPIVPEGGVHAFVRLGDGGEPVRWDPCRPIHLVVNGAERVPASAMLLDEAIAMVSAVSGLQFVVEGPTEEAPVERLRSPVQDRYGDRWAPVLVAWTDPETIPGLAGDVAGRAGAQPIAPPGGGAEVFVTGTVHLDAPTFASLAATAGGHAAARAIVAHELGHLVGLDHVDHPGELMYAWSNARTTFGVGDRVGLAELGRGPCVPSL